MESLLTISTLVFIGFIGNLDASFFITAPSIFRLNVEETVSVLTHQPSTVELYLQNFPSRTKTVSKKSLSFKANEPGIVKLKITEKDLPNGKEGIIEYVLVAKSAKPVFKKESKILLSFRNGTVFIQTDKPIYKPAQLVQYRIIPVGIDLLPAKQKIHVVIQNPNGVKVRKIKDLDATKEGFVSNTFSLDEYAIKGNWTIIAFFGDEWLQNSTVNFEVREYVLPRYSVSITPPPYIAEENRKFSMTVKAAYSYDKFVKGVLLLKLSILINKKSVKVYHSNILIENRPEKIEFFLDEILDKKNFPEFPFGARLDIDATVIEEASGQKERAKDISTQFVRSPFLITKTRTPDHYKPGLPFNVFVDITYTNNRPAVDDVNVEIEATLNGKAISADRGSKMSDRTTRANGGKMLFALDMPLEYAGSGEVSIEVGASRPGLQKAKLKFTISPYMSPSKSYLLVRSPMVLPQVGEYVNFEALIPNILDGISQISYLVISKGKILDQGTQVREAGRITSIRVKITAQMSPSARFIVHYTRNKEVVVDSILIEIGNSYGNKLKVQTDKTELKPGADVKFNIVTDQQFGYFGLLGVDKAVYYLRDSGKLDSKKIGFELKRFDTGCGLGGGRDNGNVFMNAGVVVLTDATLKGHNRKGFECRNDKPASRKRRSISDDAKTMEQNKLQHATCCKNGSCCAAKTLPSSPADSCTDLSDAMQLQGDCRLAFLRCCIYRFEDLSRSQDFFGDEAPNEIIEDVTQLKLRKYFPETWIWEDNSYGSLEKLYTLPDTVTSWIVTALSVNNVTGLGVSPPLSITGFMIFFVDVKMPYAVKRREQVNILAVLYNYGDMEQMVHLKMIGDQSFCSIAAPGKASKTMKFTVGKRNAKAIPFTITPLQAGMIPIQFQVHTYFGGDRIIRHLLVKNEGVERIDTTSLTLDPQGKLKEGANGTATQDGRQFNIIKIAVPDSFIPNSERVKVYLTGNLMTSVAKTIIEGGMSKLIRLPRGCGEQTMIAMAPGVYVMQYLEATKSGVTAKVEKNAYSYMRTGYRRILGYRRKDGSFSAWSKRTGSVWLTAFVSKVLCQARQFIEEDISEAVLCDSAKFLMHHQNKDGSFREIYPVIHKEMIGGVKGSVAITAFVLTAFLECKSSCRQQPESSLAATFYLEKQIYSKRIKNKLIMAVTTYALALAKSPAADDARKQLMAMTKTDIKNGQQVRYIEVEKGNFALNVEATAYLLLTELELRNQKSQGPLVVWLTGQRNARGSFYSTQDTCVALQALARYSASSYGGKLNLKIVITSSKNPDIKETFQLKRDSAFIRQEADITDAIGGDIFVDTTGEGTAQLQIETRFNVPEVASETCEFDLDVNVTEVASNVLYNNDLEGAELIPMRNQLKAKRCKKRKDGSRRRNCKSKAPDASAVQKDEVPSEMRIRVCARYKMPAETGFAMIEVNLLSGFEADEESLKKLSGIIDSYEKDGVKVSLYFPKIPNDKPICISFLMKRKFDVGMIQAVPVKVYRYYNPASACTKFYHPTKGSELLKVICEGEECECAQGGCHECDPTGGRPVMTRIACTKADFVFRGVILAVEPLNSWQRISVRITSIIKAGKKNQRPGSKVLVFKLTNCPCPGFAEGKEYLFMLKDKLKYIIDKDAYVREWPKKQNVVTRYRGIMDTIRAGVVCDQFDYEVRVE